MKKVCIRFFIAGALLFTVLEVAAPAIPIPNCPPGYSWQCSGARCGCVKNNL